MKKIITAIICAIIFCAFLTGCKNQYPVTVLIEGDSISLSESSDKLPANEFENKLKQIKLGNSDIPLFEKITIKQNTGIFYNSYRFMAEINPQETNTGLNITVTMSGSPSGVRNGIIQDNQVEFPIENLSETTELIAEFEENNTGVIIGIIIVLVVIMSVFVFIIKRGGNEYGSY